MPTLEITTNVGCPLDCTFCPQPAIKAAYEGPKRMSLDDFRVILSKVPRYVRIDFSGMAEPWVNTDCTAMLRHTLERGYRVAVYSTLTGMKDPEVVAGLLARFHDQVEVVVVHLPDGKGNMRGWKPSGQYKRALQAFVMLARNEVMHEVRFMAMGSPMKIAHLNDDEMMDFIGCDRAGSLDRAEIGDQPATSADHDGPVSCSFTPFYDQNVVLPNGDVALCCMDYGLKHIIGNLLTGDYDSLFASLKMNGLRRANMQFGCDGSICKKCDRATRYTRDLPHTQRWNAVTT